MKVTKRASHGIRFLVLFVALALVVTAVPLAVFLSAPTARAINVTDWNSLKSNIERTGSGSSLEVTIPNGSNFQPGYGNVINVPSGAKITVINNGTISIRKEDTDWHHIDGNMFYVNSGATLTLQGNGTYEVYHRYNTQDVSVNKHIFGTSRTTIVRNNGGTVNIASGNYNTYNHHEWNEIATSWFARYGNGNIFTWNAIVWNMTDNSVTNITGGTLNMTVYGACSSSSDDNYGQLNDGSANGGMRLFEYVYGVYGGTVNMNGGAMNLTTSSWYKGYGSENRRTAVAGTIAYGIMSDRVHMTNGTISVTSNHGSPNGNTIGEWQKDGLISTWAAGIAYRNTSPVVDGGQITTNLTNSSAMDAWNNSNFISKKNYAIMRTPSASSVSYDLSNYDSFSFVEQNEGNYPLSQVGTEHRWKASGMTNRDNEYLRVRGNYSGEPTAGTAMDSNGRTSFSGSGANMAKGQNNSASGAKNMYIFRYYDQNGNLSKWSYTPDTSIAANGHVHYVCDTPVTNTSSSSVCYAENTNGNFAPVNRYRWELRDIAVLQRGYSDTQYVDLDALIRSGTSGMTVTDRFTYPGAEHTFTHNPQTQFAPRTAGNYIYVFIDYYENAVEELRMSYTANTRCAYDGQPITVDDIGLAIYGTRNTESTDDDDNITAMVSPAYSYQGTSPSGKSLSGTGMPKDAGIYTITVDIPANSATNRAAFHGTLSVEIYAVDPGFDDTSATITYPSTLGSIDFADVVSPSNAAFADDFTYSWQAGADTVPAVTPDGTNYTVLCTVKEEARDNYLDSYANDSFNVNVRVNPNQVTIHFNAATVEYGEDLNMLASASLIDADGSNLTGEAAEDLLATIRNDIRIWDENNVESAYTPGTTTPGTYTWGFASGDPLNKGNYTVTMAGSRGSLTVTKAPLHLTVSTPETTFPYEAEFDEMGLITKTGETVQVLSSQVEGVKTEYDLYPTNIKVDDIWVTYPNGGNVGEGALIVDESAITLSGNKADCYEIVSVTCASVTIVPAQLPVGAIQMPTLEEQVYDPMRTLGDLYDEQYDYFLEHLIGGHYEPKDRDIVPSVNVPTYTFIYYPNNTNFAATEVEIPITVTKRPISVSAEDMQLVYGSSVPEPSEYVWTFSGWTDDAAAVPGKDFAALVSTNGVITESGSIGAGGATFTGAMALTSSYAPTTDAGTPVYITVNGTFDLTADNYSFTFEPGEITVGKRQLDVIAPDASAFFGELPAADPTKVVYGSDEHDFVNDDTIDSVFGASNPVSFVYGNGVFGIAGWDEYVPGVDQAGEYKIYPVFVNDNLTNYEINAIPGTLTVVKRVVTLIPNNMSITYGDEAPSEAVFVSEDPSVDLSQVFSGTIAVETDYTKGSNAGGSYYIRAVSNADGTYTSEQQPNLSVNPNYTIVFGDSAVLTVQKANLTADQVQPYVPHLSFAYSESYTLQEQLRRAGKESVTITLNGLELTGTFTYERGSERPHVSDSGDFGIIFAPTGDSAVNYNELSGLLSTVTINKAEVTGNLQLGGQMMAGGLVYPITSGLTPSGMDNYTYQWFFINEDGTETEIHTTYNRRLELTQADEGKKIKLIATIDAEINGDYTGRREYVSTVAVTPPLPVIDVSWIKTDLVSPISYDGMTHGIIAQVVVPDGKDAYTGTLTVKYNGDTALPVDAGTYYITVDCESDGNYASATALSVGTLVIQPAELTLSFDVADKVYDATTNASLVSGSIAIADGLIDSDQDGVTLNTLNARAVFADANAGENKEVQLLNVYLSGDRASNYTVADSFTVASITKATVTASARLQQYAVDYSPALADENTSGVSVYFTNITGVMSRDRAGFSIAADDVAIVDPRGGETCEIDMNTIQAVPNNNNYVVEVTNAQPLTILVNQITPDCAADLAASVLTMPSRVYDSKGNLSNEELRAFIAGLEGGKYADQAQYYSWALVDGSTPVPQVSTTATPRSYDVVYNNGDSNYREVTFKVRVPVEKREVVIQAASFTIPYGSESPLNGTAPTYTVTSGLYEDESLLSIFRAEPSVRSSYLQYENVDTYTVTVNAANLRNNNYTVSVRPGTITVTKVMLTAEAVATEKPYDGSDEIMITFTELSGKVRPNDDVYLPAFVYGTVADPNAGTNKLVTLSVPALEGSAAGNYNLTITNRNRVTVDITKLLPTDYSFPTRATVSYGEALSSAVTDGSERGDGEFYFELSNEIPANVGVYTSVYDMVFQPYDSNYESVKQKVTLEVTVAYLTIDPVVTGSVDVGNTLTVTVPGIPANALNYIHYRWYRVGSDGSQVAIGSDSASYTTVAADVGYSIRVDVSFGEGDPYQGEGSVITLPIEEEKLSLWERIWKWFYQLFEAIRRLFSLG